MTRTLTFGSDDASKFAMLYTGFTTGGNVVHERGTRSRDERVKESKILKALKEISEETDAETQQRKLLPWGGSITIEQPLHELLLKYLEQAPFTTAVSDRHADLIDWVSAADKQER